MNSVAIGIDLGTSNSCVGVFKNGRVEIIANESFSPLTPSWVCFTEDEILIGQEAKDNAHKYINNSIFEVKRLIGHDFDDDEIQRILPNLAYDVVNDNGKLAVKVDHQHREKLYFPEDISAFVLAKLKNLAEDYLRCDIKKIVITVPAYFKDSHREATRRAASIAGFDDDDVHIINEPTAAAIAFNHQNPKRYRRNILVYDFGGGTFDVSIVTISQGQHHVRATKGDLHLGGSDIDANLVQYVKEDFREMFREGMCEDEVEIRRVKNNCERAKIKLSTGRNRAEIELIDLGGRDYQSVITRSKFEEINLEIFQKTLDITLDCLDDSGLNKTDIHEVVLVGGSSRIPKLREMLKECFGENKINFGVNPDEAVAYGAAIHATCLMGHKSEVKDVVSSSLGVAVLGFISSVIIPRNTSLPAKHTEKYCTVRHNQPSAFIKVFQGEQPLVADNVQLGTFEVVGLRKLPAGEAKIDICFEINEEGILHVTATEAGTENSNDLVINTTKKGLNSEQLQERVYEMQQHFQGDLRRRKFLLAKHRLEILCHKLLDMIIEPETLEKCNDICSWLKGASVDDEEEIEKRKMELMKLCVTHSVDLSDTLEQFCN